jgi:hypothetical protein
VRGVERTDERLQGKWTTEEIAEEQRIVLLMRQLRLAHIELTAGFVPCTSIGADAAEGINVKPSPVLPNPPRERLIPLLEFLSLKHEAISLQPAHVRPYASWWEGAIWSLEASTELDNRRRTPIEKMNSLAGQRSGLHDHRGRVQWSSSSMKEYLKPRNQW